jgi:hypothetical protein
MITRPLPLLPSLAAMALLPSSCSLLQTGTCGVTLEELTPDSLQLLF